MIDKNEQHYSSAYYYSEKNRTLSRQGRLLVEYVQQNENNLDSDTVYSLVSDYMAVLHNTAQNALFFNSAPDTIIIKERENEDLIEILGVVFIHNNFNYILNKMYQMTESLKLYKLAFMKNQTLHLYHSLDLQNNAFANESFANAYADISSLLKHLNIPEKKLIDNLSHFAIKEGQIAILEFLISDEQRKEKLFSERENNQEFYSRWAISDAILHKKPFLFKYLYSQKPEFTKTDSCGIQIEDSFISFNKKKGWCQFDNVSNYLHEDISVYFTDKKLGKEQKKLMNGRFLELAEAYYYIKNKKENVTDLEMLSLVYIKKDVSDFYIKEFQDIFNQIGLTVSPKMQHAILEYRIKKGMSLESIDRSWIFQDKLTNVHKLFFDNMYEYPDSNSFKIIRNNITEFKQYFKDYPNQDFEVSLHVYAMNEVMLKHGANFSKSVDSFALCSNEIIKSIITYSDFMEDVFDRKLDKTKILPLMENLFATLSENTNKKTGEPPILTPQGEKYLLENDLLISTFIKEVKIEPRKIKRI